VQGIAVDTHVLRLANRFGFTKTKNANKVELDLIKLYDKKYWGLVNKMYISHGRATCTAKKPQCRACFLRNEKLCPRIGVIDSK
jgi:endonuclease-3